MSAAPITVLGSRFPGEVEHAYAVNFHSDSTLDLIGRVFNTSTEIAEKSGTDWGIQKILRIGDLQGARVGRSAEAECSNHKSIEQVEDR